MLHLLVDSALGRKNKRICFVLRSACTIFATDFDNGVPKIVCTCSTEAEIIPMNLIRVMPAEGIAYITFQ